MAHMARARGGLTVANIGLQSEKFLEIRAPTERVTREPWTSPQSFRRAEHRGGKARTSSLEDVDSDITLRIA